MFEDAVNKDLPDFQKKKGLKVHHSNLCSEITLATNEERTAVCCLSSVNLEYYDEWKAVPAFIPDLVRMLDNVLEYFIENAPDELYRAKLSEGRGVLDLVLWAFMRICRRMIYLLTTQWQQGLILRCSNI